MNKPKASPQERSTQMPMMYRALSVAPNSYNKDERTFEVIATTSEPCLRWNWDIGYYYEVLGMNFDEVDLEWMNSGRAPFLASHDLRDLHSILGRVLKANTEGEKLICVNKASERSSIAELVEDIVKGDIPNISIGYKVSRLVLVEAPDNDYPTYRAVKWMPYENSAVAVPADMGAHVRDGTAVQTNQCTIVGARALKESNRTMPDKVTRSQRGGGEDGQENNTQQDSQPVKEAAATTAAGSDSGDTSEKGIQAERSRVTAIMALGKKHKLDVEFVDGLISSGKSLQVAKDSILEKLAEKSDAVETRGGVSVVSEPRDGFRDAMEAAITLRALPNADLKKRGLNDEARERANQQLRGFSMLEMARACLEMQGVRTGGFSISRLVERAMHSTSDFPIILSNVQGKTLRDAYQQAEQTFRPLVSVVFARDFKQMTRAQFGEAPQLLELEENGEVKYGTVGEGKEVYALRSFARGLVIGRRAIINDDLDCFSRIPLEFGRQCANLESDLVWGILLANANMNDGNKLFSAAHGNVLTGASSALDPNDLTSLNKMRQQLRDQKGLDGKTPVNFFLNTIIVPTDLETKADQIVSPKVLANNAGAINVYAGSLQKIVEPRLNDLTKNAKGKTTWYGAAVGQGDMLELAYLDGEVGPQFASEIEFDTEGLKTKVRMDVAAADIEHRTLQRADGV